MRAEVFASALSSGRPLMAQNSSEPQHLRRSTAAQPFDLMMPLRELVQRYLAIAGKFCVPVALSSFSLSPAETERLFSGYDEDYHISRFFHFTEEAGVKYTIDGMPATHVLVDAEIETIL